MHPPAPEPTNYAPQPPLLATKLVAPRVRPHLIARESLLAQLEAHAGQKLTLVSAPAGFGKTTLLGVWVRRQPQPFAWLTLDEADNDPARFLAYLIAAVQTIAPAFGRSAQASLAVMHTPSAAAILPALINELSALPDDFVLVLDDFHTIDAPPILAILQTLVQHQPPPMHLVIATREDPPLPLARLRARGDLLELRAADLRFSRLETAAFLREVMGVALQEPAVDQLDAQMEGWVAGLQLAGLSLQNRRNPEEWIAALSGTHHFVLAYLTDEVLRRLPAGVQDFLRQTALLEQLSGPLCDAVALRTGSAGLLDELYRANVFLTPLDDEHDWYRYHPLFADLLRSQLKRTHPELAPTLYTRASAWYEAQARPAEAIDYAFAAGDFARVVRLLEAHARGVILQGYAQTVESWLRRLPLAWRQTGPRANIAFAWSLLLRGQVQEMEVYLHNAETAVSAAAASGVDAQAIAAEALALRAGLTSLRGQPELGCELARTALASAPPDDVYVRGITLFCLGTACNYAGKVSEAVAAYQQALPLCRAAGSLMASMLIVANLSLLYAACGQLHAAAHLCRSVLAAIADSGVTPPPPVATVYGSYANVLYQWNDLAQALHYAEQASTISERGGHVAALAYGRVLLVRILQARGELDAAQQTLQPALELLQHTMPGWVRQEVVAQQVSLALAQDDDLLATRLLAQAGVDLAATGEPISHANEVLFIASLRLLLHQGSHQGETAALRLGLTRADQILASAEPAGRIGHEIEVLILRALLAERLGDASRALADLRRLLPLIEPERYVRLFLDEGPRMANLLRRAQIEGLDDAYITHLLAQFPAAPTVHAAQDEILAPEQLIEQLSERELAVLRLSAQGLSYAEIADQLIVSVNTVRFHIKAIYGKLGVNNRTLAIARARALALI